MKQRIFVPILILMLLVIALIVGVGIACGENMWLWIVMYWTVLTIKNLYELICSLR